MNGSTFKRCGCRDAAGALVGPSCPALAKSSHGTWYFRAELDPGPGGQRKTKRQGGFSTQREAAAALADVLDRRNKQTFVDAGNVTVGGYLEAWLMAKANLQATTRRSYREHLDLYLLPVLGHLRLNRLTATDLDRFFAAVQELGRPLRGRPSDELAALLQARTTTPARPLTPARIRRVHATLRSALNAAVKRRLIAYNPALHVDLEQGRRPRPVVWTPERVQEWRRWRTAVREAEADLATARSRSRRSYGSPVVRSSAIATAHLERVRSSYKPPAVAVWTAEITGAFLDHAADDRLYALYHLIAFRGLRRGEAVGLRWTDVSLEHHQLWVRSQIVQLGYRTAVSEPKAGSEGVVALDQATVQVLRKHQQAQAAELNILDAAGAGAGLVFTREDGAPLHPEFVTRHFEVLVRQADLPPIRLHDLRHGAATLALAGGADLKVVSQMLRHSSITITADTYTSVLPEVARRAAEAAAALVPRTAPEAGL